MLQLYKHVAGINIGYVCMDYKFIIYIYIYIDDIPKTEAVNSPDKCTKLYRCIYKPYNYI